MNRQRIRKSLLYLSFLLYPITMFYFSPLIIIGAAKKGYVSGSCIVFIILFITSLFLGRLFCGWICPGAGMQNPLIDMKIVTKPIKGGAWIKFLIWIPWLLFILFTFYMAGGFKGFDFFYSIESVISIDEPWKYIIYYAVITIILGLAFIFGKRAFCKYVCWASPFMIIGRKIGNLLNLPSLRIIADKSKCQNCKKCNEACPMSIDVNSLISNTRVENCECTLCGSCADICPNKVIKYGWKV